MIRSKDYYVSKTPRQIGLENTLDDLYEARDALLPESLKKEWIVFPNKLTIYQNLDRLPSPAVFNNYSRREELQATDEDVALACAIHGAIRIAEALVLLTQGMITMLEYAKKYDKPKILVRQKCIRGYIPGAICVGRDWLIPASEGYLDYRNKVGRVEREYVNIQPSKTISKNNKEYYLNKTPRQIGFECPVETLQKDLRTLVPDRLWGRQKLFKSVKSILKRLDTIQKPDDYVSLIEKKNIINVSPLEMAIASTIICAICVAEAKEALFYNMVTNAEYAEKNGKCKDVIRQMCLRGTIPGATKVGTMWYVPASTSYKGRKRSSEK